MKKKVLINIKEEIHERGKDVAKSKDISFSDLVENLVSKSRVKKCQKKQLKKI